MAKKVKMLTGHEVELDGDLMAVIENLYQEVVVRKELKHTYQDMKEEIENIVAQMDEETTRAYLVESVSLNTITYENQMLDVLLRELGAEEEGEEVGED